MNESEQRLYLIKALLEESREYAGMKIPADSESQRRLLPVNILTWKSGKG